MSQRLFKIWNVLLLPIWVLVSFFAAQVIVVALIWILRGVFGIDFSIVNDAAFSTTLAALMYVLTIAIVMGVPMLLNKSKSSYEELGLVRLPSWTDIFITPAALVVYFLLSATLILIMSSIFPWIDINQAQDVGFDQVSQKFEILLAFTTLVIIAPIAEEVLFRGYLFGKLKKKVPVWVAILITSLLFGFVHLSWNVGIDTFALSVIMCILREITGSINAPILLHMTKNSIAFYLIFISGSFLYTLGG